MKLNGNRLQPIEIYRESIELYWNEECVRADQLEKVKLNVPARSSCDAVSDGTESWIVLSEVPGSELSSMVSAQSGAMDNRPAANPIGIAAKAAAEVITEVAGPATKVMALASAHVVLPDRIFSRTEVGRSLSRESLGIGVMEL